MGVPPDVVKVTLSGDLEETSGNQTDIFAFGFYLRRAHFAGNGTDWPNDVGVIATKVRDEWISAFDKARFGANVVMREVAAYHLSDVTGKAIDKGLAQFDGANSWAGVGGTSLPWECSIAVSLWGYEVGSFVQNPRRRRGRFYLPPANAEVLAGQTGKMSTVSQGFIADDVGEWLNNVQGMVLPGKGPGPDADYMSLVVLSRVASDTHQVEAIRVGRVIDSQRRRRNDQDEQYVDRVIAHS